MKPEITAKDIKQLAEKLGGYEELAVKCHVRHQTIYRWIKGIRPHKASMVTLKGIIDELDKAGESGK